MVKVVDSSCTHQFPSVKELENIAFDKPRCLPCRKPRIDKCRLSVCKKCGYDVAAIKNAIDTNDMALITNLATPNNVNCSLDNEPTPLIYALFKRNCEAMRTLLEAGAKVDDRIYDSDVEKGQETPTAIVYAASHNYEPEVSLLLEYKADATPAIEAARKNGFPGIVKILQDNISATQLSEKRVAYTPAWLIEAAKSNNLEIVKSCLEAGIPIESADKNGKTALFWACNNNNVPVLDLLIKEGAVIDTRDNILGWHPLHAAAAKGNDEIVKALIQFGANPNPTSKNGTTPLHIACEKGNEEETKLLLDSGAFINAKDSDGNTPLHSCSIKGKVNIAKVLVQSYSGVVVDAVNNAGFTPLASAVVNGQARLTKFLLDVGSNVDVKIGEKSLIDLAKENERIAIVSHLEKFTIRSGGRNV